MSKAAPKDNPGRFGTEASTPRSAAKPLAAALRIAPAELFRDIPGPHRDALYDAAGQFTQLVRDKSPDETEAVLDIVRAATKRVRRKSKF